MLKLSKFVQVRSVLFESFLQFFCVEDSAKELKYLVDKNDWSREGEHKKPFL